LKIQLKVRQNSRKQENKLKMHKRKRHAKYYSTSMTNWTRKCKKKLEKDSKKGEFLCYSFTYWIHVKSWNERNLRIKKFQKLNSRKVLETIWQSLRKSTWKLIQ